MTQLLRDVIHVLTRPHIPEGESRAIYAEPLLETLQSLIHPSASAKGNDGGVSWPQGWINRTLESEPQR